MIFLLFAPVQFAYFYFKNISENFHIISKKKQKKQLTRKVKMFWYIVRSESKHWVFLSVCRDYELSANYTIVRDRTIYQFSDFEIPHAIISLTFSSIIKTIQLQWIPHVMQQPREQTFTAVEGSVTSSNEFSVYWKAPIPGFLHFVGYVLRAGSILEDSFLIGWLNIKLVVTMISPLSDERHLQL